MVKSAPPKKVQWKRTDPQTNTVTASGWVVPKSEPYQKPDGTTCREVTQNVSKNGQTQSQDVTLCRTRSRPGRRLELGDSAIAARG